MYHIAVLTKSETQETFYREQLSRFCAERGLFPRVDCYRGQEVFFEVARKNAPTNAVISLPGVDGLNAVEHLRALFPETRIIWCSELDFSLHAFRLRVDYFLLEPITEEASVNGAMSAMMSAREGGRAMCPTSPTLYNSKFWKGDDKRRNLVLYRASDDYYFCDKYQNPQTREEYAPILRYAEVLLNEAEAAARAGDKTLALEKLNQVRDRSLADPATQTYKASDFANTKALVEAILWERRIEFQGEGRRWEDIHRLAADDLLPSGGIPAKIEYNNVKNQGAFVVGGEVKAEWFGNSKQFIPYTDKRFIWPIPLNDILRNPTLAAQQNAGW